MKGKSLGIWIAKEIWMQKDLTVMEKLFFSEINSLDNKEVRENLFLVILILDNMWGMWLNV